jgi:antitoxin (DNA-binding transcriptional repressor) of toxin-antitoxin stability system
VIQLRCKLRKSDKKTVSPGEPKIAGGSFEEFTMSATISLDEAQAKLKELIHQLGPGEEVVITENRQPVAKLLGEQPAKRKPRKAGSAKGKLIILQEDDDHLKDFAEYMK